MELLDKEADPEGEKMRKQQWRKLNRVERVGIRRLHHMTSHGTRNQMARMLRYSNAAPHVIKGVKFFRCPSCDRVEPEGRPQVVRGPDPYVFNEEIGLDIFTVKDVFDKPYQILHILCLGTCFHVGESLGQSQGVPSSRKCLEILLRSWIGWAGHPRSILVDRGTHNRGIFMHELERRGCRFKLAALEAPYQLGKVERQGGVLKGMLKRVINAENISGELEIQMALAECLETKNRQGTVGGFSPSQWVIGKNPRNLAWQDEAEDDFMAISDQDPTSSFNRRAGFRESAKLAWAHEDSHRRVRAAILRKGGSPEEEYRPGDMVSFMRRQKTGGWIGPARVLACEGKNLWLLHAGIPVLVAKNRVRGANAEEHLEVELLNKHRLSRKRPFMDSEAVQQDHRLRGEGQVPYVDMRVGAGGLGGSPDSPGGDESPKRARGGANVENIIVVDPVEPQPGGLVQQPQQLPEEPYQPPQPVATQLAGGTVEDSVPVAAGETVVVTDAELDELLGPEVAEEAPRSRSRREGRSSQREGKKRGDEKEEKAEIAEKDRSRSPHGVEKDRDLALQAVSIVLSQEFLCFMAKRKGKPDSNEIIYAREDDAMRKRLDESRAKEWSNWLKYQAIRFPSEDEVSRLLKEGHQTIPMRWVDVDKNAKLRIPGGPEVPEKLKSRLVIRGDLERESFRTDCPTASHTVIHILLAYAASKDLELHSGDISAAFLQGAPIERVLLLKAPKDGIPTEKEGFIEAYTYLIALMSVYGSKDAPRGFWLELRKELVAQGLTEIDPAFYVLIDEGETCGLLASHVDDLLWVGNNKMDETMERVQTRFTFGSKEDGSFRFCGRRIDSTPEEFKVTSPESLGKVKPIYIKDGRQRSRTGTATPEEQGQLRAVLGSVGWVARLCRPELCYMCSSLQGKQAKPVVEDLIKANKLLVSAQKTSSNGLTFRKRTYVFEESILLSVTDASHGAETSTMEDGTERGHRSQGGRFLLLGNKMPKVKEPAACHVLEWQSHSLKRVCRSTLQAEVLSSMQGSEAGQQVRTILYAMQCPRIPGDRGMLWKTQAADHRLLVWVTDCRSYIEYMAAVTPGSVSDKRLAIDLTSLRQELWRRENEEVGDPSVGQKMPELAKDQLYWICTADMIADELTKSMRWDAIRNLMDTGVFAVSIMPVRAGFSP